MLTKGKTKAVINLPLSHRKIKLCSVKQYTSVNITYGNTHKTQPLGNSERQRRCSDTKL